MITLQTKGLFANVNFQKVMGHYFGVGRWVPWLLGGAVSLVDFLVC